MEMNVCELVALFEGGRSNGREAGREGDGLEPMAVRESALTKLSKRVHPSNDLLPMVVRPSCQWISVRWRHLFNALCEIVVSIGGSVMDRSLEHPANANAPS